VKERGIAFMAPMVRAVREDRKTQTRRLTKERDGITVHPNGQVLARGGWLPELCCPYGVPGDRLWVRETWAPHGIGEGGIAYRADGPEWDDECAIKWKSPRFMPRWASRITLEIESVRVERLVEITEEDAMDEGVVFRDSCWSATDDPKALRWTTAVGAFRELWESINGPGSWDINPHVWVIKFRRITP